MRDAEALSCILWPILTTQFAELDLLVSEGPVGHCMWSQELLGFAAKATVVEQVVGSESCCSSSCASSCWLDGIVPNPGGAANLGSGAPTRLNVLRASAEAARLRLR